MGVREGVFASPEGDESAEGVRAVGVREDVGEMAEERARGAVVPHLLEAHAVDAGREAELAESRGDAPRAANKARGVARLARKHAGEELHVPRQHAKRAATGTSGGPGATHLGEEAVRAGRRRRRPLRRAKRLLRVGGLGRARRACSSDATSGTRGDTTCATPQRTFASRGVPRRTPSPRKARRDLRESNARERYRGENIFRRFARVGVGRYTS